jgi:hypothetical protein
MQQAKPRFRLGQIVSTPGALEAFQQAGEIPSAFLRRHAACDWGELCPEDRRANDAAVRHEGDPERQARVLSAYRLKDQTKIWIITEWDRSATTILLPSEY